MSHESHPSLLCPVSGRSSALWLSAVVTSQSSSESSLERLVDFYHYAWGPTPRLRAGPAGGARASRVILCPGFRQGVSDCSNSYVVIGVARTGAHSLAAVNLGRLSVQPTNYDAFRHLRGTQSVGQPEAGNLRI